MGPERVRDAYAAVSGLYIDRFGTTASVHPDDLALIERHLTGRPGAVLDAGCGPGHLTAHLRALGADATGIDLVPGFVEHARAAHPDGHYRLGALDRLDAADSSIGGILAWYSLIHVAPDELDAVLAGFARVLAPGGRLVAGFVDGDEVSAFDHKVTTAWRWPAGEFAARLRRAGFTELERLRRPAAGDQRPQATLAAVAG